MRRIDVHCYPGTRLWLESQAPYAAALTKYWRHEWRAREETDVVAELSNAGVEAILVAFDTQSVSGASPLSNDYVAALRDRYPERFVQAWASVDPWKGEDALHEAEHAIRDLRMLGFHFHPIAGAYSVDDERLRPLFELIHSLRVPVLVDVGTTGIGAATPGGLGLRIRHAHPLAIDELAAAYPDLVIVAGHPGWPWVDEMTAVALHKGNVYWELSGWAPKYLPDALKRDIRGRLRDKVLFGSDYPSLAYDRVLQEWEQLGFDDDVMEALFFKNAERVLALPARTRSDVQERRDRSP